VAGEHAVYFSASRPDDLAAALRQWLTLAAQGSAPASGGMAWMTWEQSTRQLVGRITQGQWYRQASSRLA
jgi:hypothetical protein